MRSRLFRKYAALFAGVVVAALVANGVVDILYSSRDQIHTLLRLQQQQASSAADRIGQFVKDVEAQVAWMLNLRDYTMSREDRRVDALRLLRQMPAITEIAILDFTGREEVKVSRIAPDVVGSLTDRSEDAAFDQTLARKRYFGPVYFRYGSEPYMTLGVASRREAAGVTLVEVNLRFVWDILAQIRVGQAGRVYVTDSRGVLIAHPDISLVLGNLNVSHVSHVAAAIAGNFGQAGQHYQGMSGDTVVVASAGIFGPAWFVFVEIPYAEAYAPVYASVKRSILLLGLALSVALLAGFFLARRMTGPIAVLSEATARIGAGDLKHRVAISTGDELETLSNNVNSMAERLRESYANLEEKIEQRTQQLAASNTARSRFLAIASHDLRQPLHALGLFIGQLRRPGGDALRTIEKAEAALGAMNELFDALLDISKLDAGVVKAEISAFPIQRVFARLAATFEPQAREKALSLRIASSKLWVRSDPILLERVLINLVSNAVRYTQKGGVLIGCRRRNNGVRIEVHDSGSGFPAAERENIFREFVRLDRRAASDSHGIGLGLAIVDRLSKVLQHDLHVHSIEGRGSRFAIGVPTAAPSAESPASVTLTAHSLKGQRIAVIDDDALILDGMRGLLEKWDCQVATGASWQQLADTELEFPPALIIADYSFGEDKTGIEAITALRSRYASQIPALLISGDTTGKAAHDAAAHGFLLLRKPVTPMALRAALIRLLARSD